MNARHDDDRLIVRFASDRIVEAGEAKAEAWSLAIAWACVRFGVARRREGRCLLV